MKVFNRFKTSPPVSAAPESDLLEPGARDFVDQLAPGALIVERERIHLPGEAWVRHWFVQDLPPQMERGALDALYDFPGEIRISMLVRPLDKAAVREQLRQQRTSLHAEVITRSRQGRLPDYLAEEELLETERTLQGLEASHLPPQELLWVIALYARDAHELDEQSRRLEDVLLDADLRFHRASLRQEDALYSVQPFGQNFLGHGRNISPHALAGMFPFARRLQADASGIPYGIERTTGTWVIVNDFALPNSNLLIIGEPGSGKSMFLKYKATWAVLLGMRCYILDLEGEFETMCRALGGTYLDLALESPHHMNLLDLNPNDEAAYHNGMQDVLHWIELAIGMPDLSAYEKNVILIPAYERVMQAAGILRQDPTTWKKRAPVLRDLYEAIASHEHPAAQDLAARLLQLAAGAYENAFSRPTDIDTQAKLVVFGLKRVPRNFQALRMRQIQTFIWTNILTKQHPTLVIVDEAWRWLRKENTAEDLAEMARRFRKRFASLHLATQHGSDLSASGSAVVIRDTAEMVMLFRQSSAGRDALVDLFGLNEIEAQELLTLDRGESIFIKSGQHLPLYTLIPPEWYGAWTTDPTDGISDL